MAGGCNCGGSNRTFEVDLKDGSKPETFSGAGAATAASTYLKDQGNPPRASVRVVPAAKVARR